MTETPTVWMNLMKKTASVCPASLHVPLESAFLSMNCVTATRIVETDQMKSTVVWLYFLIFLFAYIELNKTKDPSRGYHVRRKCHTTRFQRNNRSWCDILVQPKLLCELLAEAFSPGRYVLKFQPVENILSFQSLSSLKSSGGLGTS